MGRGAYMIISRFSQSPSLLISGASALSLAFAAEDKKKICRSRLAGEKSFELDLWASLKFNLFVPAIIQVCRLKVTVVHNPTYLTEFLKKPGITRCPQLNRD